MVEKGELKVVSSDGTEVTKEGIEAAAKKVEEDLKFDEELAAKTLFKVQAQLDYELIFTKDDKFMVNCEVQVEDQLVALDIVRRSLGQSMATQEEYKRTWKAIRKLKKDSKWWTEEKNRELYKDVQLRITSNDYFIRLKRAMDILNDLANGYAGTIVENFENQERNPEDYDPPKEEEPAEGK